MVYILVTGINEDKLVKKNLQDSKLIKYTMRIYTHQRSFP
jgi:hypothetical protein